MKTKFLTGDRENEEVEGGRIWRRSEGSIGERLREMTNARMVAVTGGLRGASLCTVESCVDVPAVEVDMTAGGNTVGAGDAFFGAVVAHVYANGGLVPETEEDLMDLAVAATTCGALSCTRENGIPPLDCHLSHYATRRMEQSHVQCLRALTERVKAQTRGEKIALTPKKHLRRFTTSTELGTPRSISHSRMTKKLPSEL